MEAAQLSESLADLQAVIERYWGYASLRPLQEQAMQAVLGRRDSLVVLPTGGGKSLCYQAPAMLCAGTTVVISPLISLMKDQVDGLKACGIAATQLNSSQSSGERAELEASVLRGEMRLLYISPERLANPDFQSFLQRVEISSFAIDEAHCISQWGHDFRPEYRQLNRIKELFGGAAVHAFTATATEAVRQDIAHQLGLENPALLVGNFDRPNLTYRIHSRREELEQVLEVIKRHPREAGVIYCISKRAVDKLAMHLKRKGVKAVAYHAGMTSDERSKAQEAFAQERCDVIVATVAFGMGIDRSNVRFVMHTGMPKSLEHYQQETGRAGRDGLDAECVLLYSNADLFLWRSIMERSVADSMAAGTGSDEVRDESFLDAVNQHLEEMSRYCRGAVCRHRSLVQYFGQEYESDNCGACDICLGETAEVDDADTIAQKIVSCVARVKRPFGIGHIVSILRGEAADSVLKWRHESLSTFGLMREYDKADLRDWIDQLIGQGFLHRSELQLPSGVSVPVVGLNADSLKVLRSETSVKLLKPLRKAKTAAEKRGRDKHAPGQDDAGPLTGSDQELFEELRQIRRELARERGWQPYMIFNDATLKELAQRRPQTFDDMMRIKGVGAVKLEKFGEQFLNEIKKRSAGAEVS